MAAEESPRSASRKVRQAKCLDLENLELREEVAEIAGKPTQKQLGEGSFGQVYSLQGHVVKEMLLPTKVHEAIFESEIQAWKALMEVKALHRFIPHFCGAEIRTDRVYNITRKEHKIRKGYIIQLEEPVEDLYNVLNKAIEREELFEFSTGYPLFQNLIKGFEALHAAGYIHRDIKPENILIRLDKASPHFQVPIIIDFGFACKLPCEEKGLSGTANYMPLNWHQNGLKKGRIFQGKTKKLQIKTQDSVLPPEYSVHSDNYALSIVLEELFYMIDWAGHKDERGKAEREIQKRRRAILPFLAVKKRHLHLAEIAAKEAEEKEAAAALMAMAKSMSPAAAAASPAPAAASPPAYPLFGSFFGVPNTRKKNVYVTPPRNLVPLGKGTKRKYSTSAVAVAPAAAILNRLALSTRHRSKRARSKSPNVDERPVLAMNSNA
jgi:serine/threonine protein kinase